MNESTWIDNTASSSSKQPSRLTSRKQNVTCDACRFRKVKCDRRQKVESKGEFEPEDRIACSICTSHGLRCTFTQPDSKKLRQGKRILAYKQSQQSNGSNAISADIVPSASNGRRSSGAASTSISPATNQDPSPTDPTTSPSNGESSTSDSPYPVMTSRGLYDVDGLTKPLLDACFEAYFKYYAPTIHSLQTDVLASRYQRYFDDLERANGIVSPFWQRTEKEQESQERPLSELLILAVACGGASLLEPPVADYGSSSKFRLQDKLALKFQEKIDQDLTRRLEFEGTDVVEACYILADPFLSVIGNTPYAPPLQDPLRVRPATFEGCIRLLFKLEIHRRPKLRRQIPPGDIRQYVSNGRYITKMEVFQRMRLFWTCFGSDSFRSMGTNAGVMVGDDAYDWDLPRFVPRKDGSFDSLFLCQREDDPNGPKSTNDAISNKKNKVVCLQANCFASFDIMHMQIMMRLAFVIRTVSIKLISPQSQGRSVLIADVDRAINALSAWYQQLPYPVTWELHSEKLLNPGPGQDLATETRFAIKSFFLESLYHANVLHVWSCVDAFGTRAEEEEIVAEATSLLANNLSIKEGEITQQDWSASLLPAPSQSQEDDNDNRIEEEAVTTETTKQRMDHITAQSFIRVAKIGKEAANLQLVRASRLVFVHLMRTYASWGCTLAKKLAMEKALSKSSLVLSVPPGFTQHDYILKCAEDLIFALSRIDSCETVTGQARGLTAELDRARDFCQFGQSMDTVPEVINELYGRDKYGKGILESPAPTSLQDESPAAMQIADLQSLSDADVQFLQQYLQFSNTAAPSTASYSGTSDTTSQQISPANQGYPMQSLESVYMNEVAPADQDQWTQFLTYSDAANWADTQWQGVNYHDGSQF